ncbi:hypothetical protein [Chitinophaga japonensis]|uniref:Uncharacterized protein n=1 Tax=Chitinophaga japonensis TaxID=104662 RepID=A0A562TD31_CHIJA|nr:hypothetical protein [Chitinophaga japonensis]TWI91467.1 hypothetical protein LX66_0836 [Chitinophaga japonensis]
MPPVPGQYLQTAARELGDTLALELPDTVSRETLETLLARRLEALISHHFEQFVFLLYRIDVPESQIRTILDQDAGAGAYHKIAALLIDRQLQKIRTRETFKTRPPDADW